MSPIQTQALQRAVGFLKGAGVEYMIRMPDGGEIVSDGILAERAAAVVANAKKRTRTVVNPPGFFRSIYLPVIGDQPVGALPKVPSPEGVALERLQSAVSAWCSTHWGGRNFITAQEKAENAVSVMRGA